ncbi:hypothetical protein DP113_05900 [Brasilonema octagenarum UFV-E1]|uniref:Uncharacterized protein n=2 Tax=Brasilonema TaxID=383614 RepID=A0A856MCT0_9CYAN|nr:MULTISPECIES: hypothetical protein [Brasilonema]NMF67029.1 hypothetical protein [Brasilonema octagenarum UFV-OR1]QDL07501.1 hypothetical protein DP114_05945 [Brasilonema sennae CENA114]QDL13863.1 hypothetical protein DP113_05900 [Brasilonema octagenarum UFV-E1]
MPFAKNNKHAYQPQENEALDPTSVCFKVRKGARAKLKAVPNWQERLREFVDQLICDLPKNE